MSEPEAIPAVGTGPAIPLGLCQCGCGQTTTIAPQTRTDRGWIRGQPMRFIVGHRARLPRGPLSARFWPKVDRRGCPDACWLWTAATNNRGYGIIRMDGCGGVAGRLVLAHRLSWELAHPGEPIPPETPWVLHNCPGGDNPRCVNPAHLWLGGPPENTADMVAKGRHRYALPMLHGERHPNAKLTADQIHEIHRCAATGESQRALARRFGVRQPAVSRIITGQRWAHLNPQEEASHVG